MFDVIAAPYLGRAPRVMAGKLRVPCGGTDMVLAEHCTPVHHGSLTAATLETVTFRRPHTIGFRLPRGPVPHITEEFALTEQDGTTRLEYSGEPGTDFAAAGQWWAHRVAAAWEAAVRSSVISIKSEAERRGTEHSLKIIHCLVCSLFARLPRYHPSEPGTTRQEAETKSARTGTNRHREH